MRGDARAETRVHRRTGITSVVLWLLVSGSGSQIVHKSERRRGWFWVSAEAGRFAAAVARQAIGGAAP